MADERLRGLERRWKETGFVEDHAAYLHERVRIGDLSQERLELAAYLGDPASTRAIAEEDRPEVLTADDLPGYRTRLGQAHLDKGYLEDVAEWWGQDFCMRFAVAAATHAAQRWEERRPSGVQALRVARECISEAEGWILEPTWDRGFQFKRGPEGDNNLARAAGGLLSIARIKIGLGDWQEEALSECLAQTVLAATRVAISSIPAQRRDREALLALVRRELVPWALGYSDPVRERVEARQREADGE